LYFSDDKCGSIHTCFACILPREIWHQTCLHSCKSAACHYRPRSPCVRHRPYIYTKTTLVGFVNLGAHMPVLDYQDIIQSKGLPSYQDLRRHKLKHPASSLVRIWLETTGTETLDHFPTHNSPGSSHAAADNASEPASPVQEVESARTRTQSSNQPSIYSGMFSRLPWRMSLFALEHTTSIPTAEMHQPLSEDGMHVAGTEPVIHIARGLSVKDDHDDNDAIPLSPNSWLYATRIHHHDMFCCCLLCMATRGTRTLCNA